jgi:hypothetical protein
MRKVLGSCSKRYARESMRLLMTRHSNLLGTSPSATRLLSVLFGLRVCIFFSVFPIWVSWLLTSVVHIPKT